MKTETINRWLAVAAALRSGKYPQIQRALRNRDGFCCLGVACDLIDPFGWRDGGLEGSYFNGRSDYLPWNARKFYESAEVGLFLNLQDREERWISLAGLNDSGFTFPQIADVIEWRCGQDLSDLEEPDYAD